MKGKIQYKEEQSFRNTWMYFVVIGVAFIALAGAVVPLWLGDGSPESLVGVVIALIVTIGLIVLFSFSKLTTIVDDKAIYYKFPPFVNTEKAITSADVKEMYVRKYRPIREYGGWGYRVRPGKGKALNVSGNEGLQIVKQNGKGLLIGTQKPKELERVIARLRENWEMNG